MIIENAEHSSDVRPFLPGDGGSVVLVTARARLPDLVMQHGLADHPVGALSPDAAAEASESLRAWT